MFIQKDIKVPQIRIIPMDKGIFDYQPIEGVQQEYFIEDLKKRNECKYTYNGRHLESEHGALLLFQYDNRIIASAQLDYVDKEFGIGEGGEEYDGALCLERNTISIFEPIAAWELGIFDPNIKRFSQSKKKVNIDLQDLVTLLKRKTDIYAMSYQEKVSAINIGGEKIEDLPKTKSSPISAELQKWSRDPIEGKKAIQRADFKCEYDDTHVFFISKTTGRNYVECHHFIPMKFQDEFNTSIDVAANIISVCPVCHRKLHSADLEDKKDMLLTLLEVRKKRLIDVKVQITGKQLLEFYS